MAINKNDYLDANGDYDLKKALVDELIDDVNTLTSTTTATVYTSQNGWTGTLTLKRYGNLVSLEGYLGKTGTTATGTILTTIPSGFRPSQTTPISAALGNISPYIGMFIFWLNSDGTLIIRTAEPLEENRTNSNIYINQVYAV